jgi:hypothetical protein
MENIKSLLTNTLNPQARLMQETRGLVTKWDKTGLLDGIKSDIEKSNSSYHAQRLSVCAPADRMEAKKEYLSIGIGGMFRETKKMNPRQYLRDFLKRLDYIPEGTTGRTMGHLETHECASLGRLCRSFSCLHKASQNLFLLSEQLLQLRIQLDIDKLWSTDPRIKRPFENMSTVAAACAR